jgi:acetoacetyl-CoA reductase
MSQQRVVLVTGGMGGLGETISTKMVDAGYKVAVTYSPGNKTHADWVAQMAANGYAILAVPCDVADFASCARAVAEVQEKLGPVDVLVNNAGITRDMTFKKMDKVNWDAVLRTNLDSLFNMTKQVADTMAERNWGRIINVSSVNGSKGAFGQTNYSAAKAGVHGFTKALALEVAKKNVTVNTISPGYIGTKMVTAIPKEVLDSKILPHIPVGRLGKPEEVAGLIIYLASEEAAFLTGANIAINGGQARHRSGSADHPVLRSNCQAGRRGPQGGHRDDLEGPARPRAHPGQHQAGVEHGGQGRRDGGREQSARAGRRRGLARPSRCRHRRGARDGGAGEPQGAAADDRARREPARDAGQEGTGRHRKDGRHLLRRAPQGG